MFNTRILAFRVFTDEDSVDVVIEGLVPLNRHAWPDVGEQGECSSEGQIERDVTSPDWTGDNISDEKNYNQRLLNILGVANGPV
jgi:hypothetical protein